MKNWQIGVIAAVGLFVIGYFALSVLDTDYNLGELDPVPYNSSEKYCNYKVTETQEGKKTRFKVGNVVCITCCVERKPAWPIAVGVNNNCPKEIRFNQKGEKCEIKAERIGETCTACDVKKSIAVFECPKEK